MSHETTSFKCVFCDEHHALGVAACPASGKPIEPVHRMEGKVLGDKYIVSSFVAEGGMGVVYEGLNRDIGRRVAIKFLMTSATTSANVIRSFENEARIATSVGSRNIVDILDMGVTPQGIHYIVMEYLEGTDLSDFLDEAIRLPYPWAVDITIQILGALRQVHSRGVVHRDLKPGNVVLVHDPSGAMLVKIVDFGISCLQQTGNIGSLARGEQVFGTPRYMSPEQARGLKNIDNRADLYSVGVMLYRMISGNYPHDSEDIGRLVIKVASDQPMHIAKHGVALPTGLEAVIMWALAPDPEERFGDAEEFIEALMPYRDVASLGALKSVAPDGRDDSGWEDPLSTTGSQPHPISAITSSPEREDATMKVEASPTPSLAEYQAPIRVRVADIPSLATIRVDGMLQLDRPVILSDGPGRYTFRIEAPDHEPWERTVEVDSDVMFFVELKPLG